MGGVDELVPTDATSVDSDEVDTGFFVDDVDGFADFVVDHLNASRVSLGFSWR